MVPDEEILAFITEYTDGHGFPPTVREVAAGVGLSSPGSVKWRIDAMRDKGLLTYETHKFRTLRVVRHEDND